MTNSRVDIGNKPRALALFSHTSASMSFSQASRCCFLVIRRKGWGCLGRGWSPVVFAPWLCITHRLCCMMHSCSIKGKIKENFVFISPDGRNPSSQATRDKVELLGLVTHETKAPVLTWDLSLRLSQ